MQLSWEAINANEQLRIIDMLAEYFPGLSSEDIEKKAKIYYETRLNTHK